MIPFRRFIVFAFHRYYPDGGFNDIRGSFDTLGEIEELIEADDKWYFFDKVKFSSYQIFDREEGVMIRELIGFPGFLR